MRRPILAATQECIIATTGAIVLAGGSGSRAGTPTNKVYTPIAGRMVISHGLMAFDRAEEIAGIVLVVRAGDERLAERAIREAATDKVVAVVQGGATRHDSEVAGLAAVTRHLVAIDSIAIHDAARPFVTAEMVKALVAVARRTGAAVPGVRVVEPVVQVVGTRGRVLHAALAHVQTPQVFSAQPLIAAYQAADAAGFAGVDTAETVARFGRLDATLVLSDPRNLKITFASDLVEAGRIVESWTPERLLDPI